MRSRSVVQSLLPARVDRDRYSAAARIIAPLFQLLCVIKGMAYSIGIYMRPWGFLVYFTQRAPNCIIRFIGFDVSLSVDSYGAPFSAPRFVMMVVF